MTDEEKLLKIEELRLKLARGVSEWVDKRLHIDIHIFGALEYFDAGEHLGWKISCNDETGEEMFAENTVARGNITLYK